MLKSLNESQIPCNSFQEAYRKSDLDPYQNMNAAWITGYVWESYSDIQSGVVSKQHARLFPKSN